MVYVIKGSGSFRVRRAVLVTLLMWPLSATSTGVTAQQFPASVASDLVDRALADTLELRGSVDSRDQSAWSIPMVVVAGMLLLLALAGAWSWAKRVSRSGRGVGPEAEPSAPEVGRRPEPASRSRSKPKATMQLPPHVVEIMRRAEERRAREALDAAGVEVGDAAPAVSPPTRGIDIVVPR